MMTSATAVWYLVAVTLVVSWLILYIKRGARQALGAAVVLSMLVPVWVEIPVLGQQIGCRTVVAIIGIVGFTVYRRGRILTPLTMLDVFITIIALVHLAADVYADEWHVMIPFRAYGEWVLPYVAGRFAIQDCDDLKAIVPWVVSVLVVLSVCGLVESLSGINVLEAIVGDRPLDDGAGRHSSRFGLKRAFGNAIHPIFFANQLLLLVPWCFGLIQKGSERKLQVFGGLALLVAFLGICSSVSRGPVMAFLIMFGVMALIRFKILRWAIAIGLTAVVAVICFFPTASMDFLAENLGGETLGDRKTLVEIEGEAVEYTGTNSRLLIFEAYGAALRHAGLTGYGTKLTTGFPPNIPYLQVSRHSVQRLKYVDNAYVFITLRFGFLGLGTFTLLLLSGIYTAACLVKRFPQDPFFPAVCGSFTGFALVLMTVWFCYDFGFIALWMLGILAGCAILPNDQVRPLVYDRTGTWKSTFPRTRG
ncbi:MAG TPA: O-antigen ligase family protein [Planctomycetaceae bacterium]|nr:O-antigen ligase family protein [Planctomycetaceae bacterium]